MENSFKQKNGKTEEMVKQNKIVKLQKWFKQKSQLNRKSS